jgi:Fe-S cluster biosynthesis and repair protein YggX
MEIFKKCTSFKLEIVGQLIDSFLGEIGRGIYAKLGRSTISNVLGQMQQNSLINFNKRQSPSPIQWCLHFLLDLK